MYKIKLVYVKGAEIGTRKLQSYPLGIMLLKVYAESIEEIKQKVAIDIEVLDYDVQDEAFVNNIYVNNYDMVLFSTYIWNISRSIELSRKIKIVKENIYVGFGGPEVNDANEIMKQYQHIDFISVGEGEKSFIYVIRKYLLNQNIIMHGVVFKSNGEIIDTGSADLIENLDDIPSIVGDEYLTKCDMLLYETSRGCPFQCKYCCWAGKKMRYYSLERVENDLKEILSLQSGKSLFLIDSELDINIDRAKRIMGMIKKYNIHNKLIHGFLGLHIIDEELLQLCKDVDFRFGVGIQSVNPEAILQCGRNWFDVKKFEEKIKIIGKYYDISDIEFQLIMGLPGDNYETFKNNLKWCESIGATKISANRLYVLPGSYFYYNSDNYKMKFDKKPYHLIYSNYSYSYEDIMRSEALLVAFQYSKEIFGSLKRLKGGKENLIIWNYIDTLVDTIKEKNLYSQGRQESQIVEKEYDMEKIMIDNLDKIECRKNVFEDFIHMRFTQIRANRYYRYDCPRYSGCKYAKINSYFVSPYVKIDVNGNIIEAGKNYYIYLHDFKKGTIRKMIINNQFIEEVKKVLDLFIEGISEEEIKKIQNITRMGSLVTRILNENLCYYSDVKGKKYE